MTQLQPPVFKRYRDLAPSDINVEYHVHTVQTDGKGTIEEILAIARKQQLSTIAFTEHVRRETDWFPMFAMAIQVASKQYPDLKVYIGCEAKVLNKNGDLDVTPDIKDMCHLILGSVHRFPGNGTDFMDWKLLSDEEFAQLEFELAEALLRAAPIHVLAHPGGMYQRQRRRPFPEMYLRQLMDISLERGIAFEVNTSYTIDLQTFLRLCQEINPYISIGSDAHTLEEIGRCRDLLFANMRE